VNKPRIIDLTKTTGSPEQMRCDVCIVGAGAIGIYLGMQLANTGLDVVLLEAGGHDSGSYADVGFKADFSKDPYPGATQGRFFGLGGSTSQWGGLLFPYTHLDVRTQTDFQPDQWPRIVRDVEQYGQRVLGHLGFTRDPDFFGFAEQGLRGISPALKGIGLQPAASLFIPFRKRNFKTQLHQPISNAGSVRVVINSVVNAWSMRENDPSSTKVASVSAVSPNEQSVTVRADRFVISAGTIESTRLLLELDSQFSTRVTRATSAVGCYMSDHLSCVVADTEPVDTNKAIRLFSPRFQRGWMRSLRFMENEPQPGGVRAFGHIVFDQSSPGFNVVRDVLYGVQNRKIPRLSLGDLFTGFITGAGIAWSRFVQNELHVPRGTKSRFLLDTEQVPLRENHISLGNNTDRYGRRSPIIHWKITQQDLDNMATIGARMVDSWNRSSLDIPRLKPRELQWDSSRPYDTFHAVGTCRMGEDDEAVVSPELQVWGVDNLWVASTAVLPTVGTANPTFPLLCMVQGLCDRMTS
jgi:choline dehydrogenase-like flavoprotein